MCTVLPNSVVSRLKQNVLTSHMFRRAMPFSSDQAKQANKQQPVFAFESQVFFAAPGRYLRIIVPCFVLPSLSAMPSPSSVWFLLCLVFSPCLLPSLSPLTPPPPTGVLVPVSKFIPSSSSVTLRYPFPQSDLLRGTVLVCCLTPSGEPYKAMNLLQSPI